jgi:hypothetical protein
MPMKKSSRLDHALPGTKLYIQMKLVENCNTPFARTNSSSYMIVETMTWVMGKKAGEKCNEDSEREREREGLTDVE